MDNPLIQTLQIERCDTESWGRLHHAFKTLPPATAIELVSAQAPELLLESLRRYFRDRIRWRLQQTGPPSWRVMIHRREETAPTSAIDLLSRDHERLDQLLVDALNGANHGELESVRSSFGVFAEGIRRHIRVEEEVLLPTLPPVPSVADRNPLETMRQEHADILDQVANVEEALASEPEPAEIAIYLGLLSGLIAKHTGREEETIFPVWENAMEVAPPGLQKRLTHQTDTLLHHTS